MNPFGNLDPDSEEFGSVEAFVEFLLGEEEEEFDWRHLQCLNYRLHQGVKRIRRELESYGLSIVDRPKGKNFRTFGSNPHDRWYGPGACRTFGGSGWEQIVRIAGQKG